MGFDTSPKGLVIREKIDRPQGAVPVVCPKCGGTNPRSATRCRSCLTTLPSNAPSRPAPRTVTPVVHSRADVDMILGELEALTREDEKPPVHFQCPSCGRLVEETARRCRCGAIFEDPRDAVRYECPICGARVAADATRCHCGARFAD